MADKPNPRDLVQAVLADPHSLNRSQPAVRLAIILNAAAVDLWEVSTLEDVAEMWEQARIIATRILAACHRPE